MNLLCLAADILNRLCQGYDLDIPGIVKMYFLDIHAQLN